MNRWIKFWIVIGVLMAISAVVGLIFLATFVTVVDKHEFSFVFNRVTGQIEKIESSGWVVRCPIINSVHKIDLRPYQVQFAANARILNAKLVQFDPAGLDVFIQWHGRSAGDRLNGEGGLLDILKSYAFDKENGADCPFLKIINEVAPSQAGIPLKREMK